MRRRPAALPRPRRETAGAAARASPPRCPPAAARRPHRCRSRRYRNGRSPCRKWPNECSAWPDTPAPNLWRCQGVRKVRSSGLKNNNFLSTRMAPRLDDRVHLAQGMRVMIEGSRAVARLIRIVPAVGALGILAACGAGPSQPGNGTGIPADSCAPSAFAGAFGGEVTLVPELGRGGAAASSGSLSQGSQIIPYRWFLRWSSPQRDAVPRRRPHGRLSLPAAAADASEPRWPADRLHPGHGPRQRRLRGHRRRVAGDDLRRLPYRPGRVHRPQGAGRRRADDGRFRGLHARSGRGAAGDAGGRREVRPFCQPRAPARA